MLARNTVYYEARIVFGMATLLPLLLLPGYTFLGWILWTSRQSVPPLHQIINVFELMLTLSGGLACAHLMTIEREEGFDEIRRTYAEQSWYVTLLRTGEAFLLISMSGLLAASFFYLAYGQYDLGQVVLPALAPALYLCSLSLLINNATGSYWIAAGVIVAYWYGELASAGIYTKVLFLFNHSMPQPEIDPNLNRFLLILGSLLFFTANAGFSAWRRRGTVGR